MQHGLQTLLGQEAAAAVLAAAEAAACSMVGPKPGDMPQYTSIAATMPVSMKVGAGGFLQDQMSDAQCVCSASTPGDVVVLGFACRQ
jgi:hypothetical protein